MNGFPSETRRALEGHRK